MRIFATEANLPPPPELAGLRGDLELDEQVPVGSGSTRERYVMAAKWYLDLLRRDLMGEKMVRDAAVVSKEYEETWSPSNAEYADQVDQARAFFFVRGRPHFVNGWFMIKRYTGLILDIIDRLKAQSVLEVGAGRGKNLALFALKRPNLSLTGLELTDSGVASSKRLPEDLPPQFLRVAGVPTLTDEGRAALRRIDFTQGNAMKMAFPDKSFDASFTTLVLEQLPRDFPKVLSEMRRVTRKYCIFNEAFDEANSWRGRAYLRRLDYFNASYREFEKYGLEPIFFTTALPQKMTFRTGCLVARVRD
jgi:SAM-dependent methyltransferase